MKTKASLRLAYVLGEYPSISETFITNEVAEMTRIGAHIHIFALTRTKPGMRQTNEKHINSWVSFPPDHINIPNGRLSRWLPGGANSYLYSAPIRNLRAVRAAQRLWPNHFFLATWLALHLRMEKTDHIHAHFPEPSLVASIASLLTGIPMSFSVHSHIAKEMAFGLSGRITRASFVRAVGTAVKNDIVAASGLKVSTKIRVVHIGLSTDFISKTESLVKRRRNGFRILSVARLVQHKGLKYLLLAASLLAKKIPSFSICIIGDGPERGELTKLSKKLGIEKIVRFLGSVPHNETFFRQLAAADLFVLPCCDDDDGNRDGIPAAILEAMASRIPVISTNTSSIPEAVDKHCGRLVEEKNPQAIVAAISFVYRATAETRFKMGEYGRKRVIDHYLISASAKKMTSLIKHKTKP